MRVNQIPHVRLNNYQLDKRKAVGLVKRHGTNGIISRLG